MWSNFIRSFSRLSLVLTIAIVPFLISACGKDQKDTADLNGEVGNVPGSYVTRPANSWRAKIDSLQEKITGVFPGLSASLTQRFKGSESSAFIEYQQSLVEEIAAEEGVKLSDLVQVNLPSTNNETINRQVFGSLKGAKDDSGGSYFDLVDTEKYTGKKFIKDSDLSLYDPPEGATADAFYNQQYYLDMIRWQDAVKTEVTDALLLTAQPVLVAVLDTGVLSSHEDFNGVLWKSSTGIIGFDSTSKSGRELTATVDPDGHGTHVAGIIGAKPKNGVGVQGIAAIPGRGGDATKYLAELMPVTVLNANGSGTSEMISRGIKWSVDTYRAQKATDTARANQKLIINMSLGGPFDATGYKYEKNPDGTPIFLDDLFADSVKNDDVLIVVAAGNESCKIGGACGVSGQDFRETYYYPCSYTHVLCVAASTQDDKLAGFSNRQASVGITAPGWQIISTSNDPSNTKAAIYSGTSQATPVTAGAAALVWSLYPGLKASELKSVLIKSAATIGTISTEIKSGSGRLDVYAALLYAKQLKASGKTPDVENPGDGLVAKVTPTAAAAKVPKAAVEADPYALSPDARGGKTTATGGRKGKGSGGGCGVLGSAAGAAPSALAWLLALFMPIGVLAFGARRRS